MAAVFSDSNCIVVKEGHWMLMEESETKSLIFSLLMDSRMKLFISGQKES